jgi:pimeloyl-ACP methyl ester carboxylesterase
MLAPAYAAAHPERNCPLALIGCVTFDAAARNRYQATVAERMTGELRARLAAVEAEIGDPDARMAAGGRIFETIYCCDPTAEPGEIDRCDARAHEETWRDMLRLQAEDVYPAAFAAIRSPVLMLHGAFDPHPGEMIRDGLARYLPQLEYREWERCGHEPWRERAVREKFFGALLEWLARTV